MMEHTGIPFVDLPDKETRWFCRRHTKIHEDKRLRKSETIDHFFWTWRFKTLKILLVQLCPKENWRFLFGVSYLIFFLLLSPPPPFNFMMISWKWKVSIRHILQPKNTLEMKRNILLISKYTKELIITMSVRDLLWMNKAIWWQKRFTNPPYTRKPLRSISTERAWCNHCNYWRTLLSTVLFQLSNSNYNKLTTVLCLQRASTCSSGKTHEPH